MQEQTKLLVAELDNQKIEFFIFMSDKQKLGEGAFGVVRKGFRNDKPNQLLAVKIIHYENDSHRITIEKQIEILRKLPKHPNLVRVQPLKCFSQNNYYIFMEYCPDGTLDELRRKKNNIFTQRQILDIFYQLMSGYKVLWDNKILHQDLKPQNVLIKNGKYKLTDFGFSIFYTGTSEDKLGSIRKGTIHYMPLQKMTNKQYYASPKSDIYALGVILFKLITGHYPYVQNSNDIKNYQKQFKKNSLCLNKNFSSRFSMKFQHFFDLVLRMVAKTEHARISFQEICEYIEKEELFDQIRIKNNKNQKSGEVVQYSEFVISASSTGVAVHFDSLENQKCQNVEIGSMTKQIKKDKELEKVVQEIENYIVSHRIIVYYFDRLTRRIYIQKLKKNQTSSLSQSESLFIEKLTVGLLLLCKRITRGVLKEQKQGKIFPIKYWSLYTKQFNNLIKIIKMDESYLEDLIMDSLSESSQTKIKSLKELVDKSNQSFSDFKLVIKDLLEGLLKERSLGIQIGNKQNLITICYIISGIQILEDFEKYEKDAIYLQKYFRNIETEDEQVLFQNVTENCLNKKIDFYFNLEEKH